MFSYIYQGNTHTDTSPAYMQQLGMDSDQIESVLLQKEYEFSSLSDSVRQERNLRLAATDFYMLPDAPPTPVGVAEYRQALRDITEQEGFPFEIVWPEL